jgi:phage major head subunit gpT-like protein
LGTYCCLRKENKVKYLTQRAIIGEFYRRLAQDLGVGWVGKISNYFVATQMTETYAWLGQVPQMREWIGGRLAKQLSEFSFTITNKHYESTLEFLVIDLMLEKSGQLMIRIGEQAQRANSHWAKLLSTLIVDAPSTVCYDGQFFFDTDHEEGDSGAQSNDITVDISDLAVQSAGTTTVPSVAEMQGTIMRGVTQIASIVDDRGEPMNEDASKFLIMTPMSLYHIALQAITTPVQVAETQTALEAIKQDVTFEVQGNVRLSSWTASFAMFRTDAALKSFIRQELHGVKMKAKGEGSEYEFDNDAHQYGIDARRNVGYGMWQNACLVTMG